MPTLLAVRIAVGALYQEQTLCVGLANAAAIAVRTGNRRCAGGRAGSITHLTADGQVMLDLRHRWADGTTQLLFEPVELLERRSTRATVNLQAR